MPLGRCRKEFFTILYIWILNPMNLLNYQERIRTWIKEKVNTVLSITLRRDSNEVLFQLWGLASIDEMLASFMTYQLYPWKDIYFLKCSTLVTTFFSSPDSSYNLPSVFTSQLTLYILKSTIISWQWNEVFSGFILFGSCAACDIFWYVCMHVYIYACIYVHVCMYF